ncbi:MAG: ribosome biogenesis GTP-binding protein YihA/YsxC [Myxococcaceae bacterium]
MIRVLKAEFVASAAALTQAPLADRLEVAFVGRSNVGKSSMMNALCARKKLVRVSNTPGRTRLLNFFDVLLEVSGQHRELRLCDLPGYGYAKVSKSERSGWDTMIREYLENRTTLRVVVALVDAEIGLTPDDERTLDYLLGSTHRILLVATKLDRLPKAKRKPVLWGLAEKLGISKEAVLGFSATDKIGVVETWESLVGVLFPRAAGAKDANGVHV